MTLIDDPRHRLNADGTARLSMEQAKAILDLRLQRLTALGREEISEELDKMAAEINEYLDILRSRARVQAIIKTELAEVKSQFSTPRRDWPRTERTARGNRSASLWTVTTTVTSGRSAGRPLTLVPDSQIFTERWMCASLVSPPWTGGCPGDATSTSWANH